MCIRDRHPNSTSSNVTTQTAVSDNISSVMAIMTVKTGQMNGTAVSYISVLFNYEWQMCYIPYRSVTMVLIAILGHWARRSISLGYREIRVI